VTPAVPEAIALETARRCGEHVADMTSKRKHTVKEGGWRVYAVKHPTDLEGRPFHPQGKATLKDGWFWIRRGDEISLYVRVHGLGAARALCRQLNRGASEQRKERGV
jgi:hypothetical protein